MASQNQKVYTLFILLPLFLLVSVLVVDLPLVRGRVPNTFKRESSAPTNGTVKTVEGDNGDVMDCVDIYKQPAFNHPLLKDHKLQMEPSLSFNESYENNSAPEFIQTWHKNGMCSEGTVPVRRRQLQDSQSPSKQGPHLEHASIIALPSIEKKFYGGGGKLSLWNPAVSRTEDYSASTVMIVLSDQAYIEAGWIVHPEGYGDFETRFFVYWTIDNSDSTGCFDLFCEGFVQVNKEIALGAVIDPVSTVGLKTQLVLKIIIVQDPKTGDWWVRVGGKSIGYWPAALFTGIPKGADMIKWGGEIFDSIGSGQHTETDMGNGLFPDTTETHKASLVCSLQYVDSSFTLRTPSRSSLELVVTNPLCYNAELLPTLDPNHGLCFLFGGPGKNPQCP